MMKCGTLDAGYEIYECHNCHSFNIICYTCKSRFCNSCGIKAAKIRAYTISKNTLNVKHRYIVFTIDDSLRIYFKKHRDMLNLLFDAANDTLMRIFHRMLPKKNVFTPGFIFSLHTFGKSLIWNPHIHCLITEGGLSLEGTYKRIDFISYNTLSKSFMTALLTKMKEYLKSNHESELKEF